MLLEWDLEGAISEGSLLTAECWCRRPGSKTAMQTTPIELCIHAAKEEDLLEPPDLEVTVQEARVAVIEAMKEAAAEVSGQAGGVEAAAFILERQAPRLEVLRQRGRTAPCESLCSELEGALRGLSGPGTATDARAALLSAATSQGLQRHATTGGSCPR